jgi:D-arabinose 1-dehydrogenase-like Zn-dependent alcohol dehydrogenase
VAVSKDFELVAKLGADVVLDYTDPNYLSTLTKLGGFDVIFDFSGQQDVMPFMQYLHPWSGAKYVTLTSPLMRSADKSGVVAGGLKTLLGLACSNVQTLVSNGNTLRYGYFVPNPMALKSVAYMVEQEMVTTTKVDCWGKGLRVCFEHLRILKLIFVHNSVKDV